MIFSSVTFLFLFLPLVLVSYYCCRGTARNFILLFFSLFFYAWGEEAYVLIMLFSIGFNYVIGLLVGKSSTPVKKRGCLVFGVFANLFLLAYFKYANWFLNSIGISLSEPIHLPIGISFFTFQAISYVVDVYRDEVAPQRNPFELGLYISSFPQLIAGPIVRYHQVSRQIVSRQHNYTQFARGVERFVFGLSKKVLIANSMAEIADLVFAQNYTALSWEIAWLGILSYTLQIYFDFSGYSDMAVGLGLMFGFKFPENFNHPYIASSIQDFWRRWHISLSRWFRDYLYIPLGGNREGKIKKYRNLFIVFLLCGLWHGASWNFVVWGLIHGIFIVFEYVFLRELLLKRSYVLGWLYTMFVVIHSWVFFRVGDLVQAVNYLKAMYGLVASPDNRVSVGVLLEVDNVFIFFFVVAVVLSVQPVLRIFFLKTNFFAMEGGREYITCFSLLKYIVVFFLMYLSFSFLAVHSYNPFIYFRF